MLPRWPANIWSSVQVGDGRELLAEAERLHPDVIVLDTN
jgi:hypothetical protein